MTYPAGHPFEMFNSDYRKPAQQPAMRTARGYITQAAVLEALRSLGRATPTQIGVELGVPMQQVGRLLYAMLKLGEVDRKAVQVQSPAGPRSTYEYWIIEQETSQ